MKGVNSSIYKGNTIHTEHIPQGSCVKQTIPFIAMRDVNDVHRPAFLSVDVSLLLLRMSAGGLMITPGWPKLLRLAEGSGTFAGPLGDLIISGSLC